jgi:hypothetical protein
MVEERTGENQMNQPGTTQQQDGLPEFLDPEKGGSDAANPNLNEIQSILDSQPDSLEVELPPDDDILLDEEIDDAAPRMSLFGPILIAVCLAVIVAGVFYIRGNEQYVADLDCFLTSDIAKCKHAGVEELMARWREEDTATRPKYGDLVLTYYPQDAKVTITQKIEHFAGYAAFDKKTVTSTEDKPIPNKSTELKENEVIEQLPLMNLPILERTRNDEGDITDVTRYTYHIQIVREGYEPREFEFGPADWQKLGPDVNYSIPWTGADLVPKPETVMEPFAKAMRELYCLEKHYESKGKKAGMTEGDLRGMRKEIEIRHGFKTTSEFEKFKQMLTAMDEWWKPKWEEITKEKCPEPEAAP